MNASKAWVAAVVAGLTVLVTQGQELLPPLVLLVIAAAVAGLATYAIPNRPKRH